MCPARRLASMRRMCCRGASMHVHRNNDERTKTMRLLWATALQTCVFRQQKHVRGMPVEKELRQTRMQHLWPSKQGHYQERPNRGPKYTPARPARQSSSWLNVHAARSTEQCRTFRWLSAFCFRWFARKCDLRGFAVLTVGGYEAALLV